MGVCVFAISHWYADLGDCTFPTVFVRLSGAEIEALLSADSQSDAARKSMARLDLAIQSLPGASFVGADVCAPTDSPQYRHGHGLRTGRAAWELLAGSRKICDAFRAQATQRFTVRPFRRMERTREFRMFICQRRLAAMSQYHLDGYAARLHARQAEIWSLAQAFAAEIIPWLAAENFAMDVYLTSDRQLLVVDLNPWGDPTSPLLLRGWDRDWTQEAGLKLIPKPVKMKGEISVSF